MGIILLLFFVVQTYAQLTCTETQITYYGRCLERSCYERVSNSVFKVVSYEPENYEGKIQFVVGITNDETPKYKETIIFEDSNLSPLFGNDCLSFKIFTLISDKNLSRQPVLDETWPITQYQTEGNKGQITFEITQTELDTKGCWKILDEESIQWVCSYELAFQVFEEDQISYYFSFRVNVDSLLAKTTGGQLEVQRAYVMNRCQEGDSNCALSVDVSSGLAFCTDSTCTELITTQQSYTIGETIYLVHYIRDGAFGGVTVPFASDSEELSLTVEMFINPPQIQPQTEEEIIQNEGQAFYISQPELRLVSTADGFELSLKEDDGRLFQVEKRSVGYNIYTLVSPLAQLDVTIYASGVLVQVENSSRRLLSEAIRYQVETNIQIVFNKPEKVGEDNMSDIEGSQQTRFAQNSSECFLTTMSFIISIISLL